MTGTPRQEELVGLQAVKTHIFSSMGPWLRRTDTVTCLAHRFQKDKQLLQAAGTNKDTETDQTGEANTAVLTATGAAHTPLAATHAAATTAAAMAAALTALLFAL